MGLRITSVSSEKQWWGHSMQSWRPWSPLSCLLLRLSQEKCQPTNPQTNRQEGPLGSPQKLMGLQRHGSMVGFSGGPFGDTPTCSYVCVQQGMIRGHCWLWQDRLSVVSWLLEGSTLYLHLYMGTFLSSKGLSSKPARGEKDVFPQGICTQHLPVGPMDLELWQHYPCRGNGFGTSLQPVLAENTEKHSQICGNIS